jgi:hypothetical protein
MDHIKTSERAMCAICHMFGIGADAYTEAWYEAGCTHAERNYPLTGRHLIRSKVYWQRWNKRWVEVVFRFIAWNNPEKTLKDLCKLAADRNALMPKFRFYIDKYPVP